MISAKEIDGELWIRAADHHQAIKNAQRTWVGLTAEDLAVCGDEDDVMLARYWERVCKEKNGA